MSPPTDGRCWARVLLAVSLAGCSHGIAAQDTDADTDPAIVTAPLDTVDSAHGQVSDTVERMAKGIDRFFADERAFEEDNETSVQLRLDFISDEDRMASFDSGVRARVRLPGSERRLRLVFESDPREVDPDAPQENPADAIDDAKDYIIGLEGERLLADWQLRPSVGVKAKWPPDPYARLRAIRYFPLGNWIGRVSGTASWFSSDGIGLNGTVDFDRKLSATTLFRSATTLGWDADDSYSDVSQVFSVYQHLALQARLAYDAGLSADNDPGWDATEYFVQLRYRRLFYKTWAYLEVRPRISWPEDNDFHEDLSLLVRLELNFGRAFR